MISFSRTADTASLITVAAVGDVLMHDSVQKFAAGRPDGFYATMAPVADLIQAANVAFANLEGPAAAGVNKAGRQVREPKRRYDGSIYSGYPLFNYHPSIAADLRRVGFDVVLTANNHSLDRYQLGADKTVDAVAAAGLLSTGSKKRKNMSRPWYAISPVRHGGKIHNIAWLGCTYSTNGIPDRARQVLHCYRDRALVVATVRALAKRSDIAAVIVTPHWGSEYRHTPNGKERLLAREILNAGATAVIGTHPHVIQPFEKYRTTDGRETFIAYSLGNFVSNQIGLPRRSSAILMLGLTPDEKGKLHPARIGWVPIWMHKGRGLMQVEAIDRARAPGAYRRHLTSLLPAGNVMLPKLPLWQSPPECKTIASQPARPSGNNLPGPKAG